MDRLQPYQTHTSVSHLNKTILDLDQLGNTPTILFRSAPYGRVPCTFKLNPWLRSSPYKTGEGSPVWDHHAIAKDVLSPQFSCSQILLFIPSFNVHGHGLQILTYVIILEVIRSSSNGVLVIVFKICSIFFPSTMFVKDWPSPASQLTCRLPARRGRDVDRTWIVVYIFCYVSDHY